MAQGQIIIRRKNPNVTYVQNSIIWDENISTMARFSLIAMLSMREGWDYSVRGMAAMLHVSKDTMSKYIRELESAGYLKREQGHSEEGKFGKAVYILTDTTGDFGEADTCPENYDTADTCPKESAPVTSAPKKSPQQKRNNKQQKREERTTPQKPPKGGRRGSKYDLAEDAKPLLQAYVAGDQELHRMLGEFIKLRVELQAINSREAIKRLLNRLDKLSGGDRGVKLQLLDQSITSSWKSVFPLRGKEGQQAQAAPPQRPAETRRWHTEVRDGEEVVVYD